MAVDTKKLYEESKAIVDEQALLDKFNAVTTAQYNLQREQNRQAENAFYNQMYNSQQTAVDAIRQANAAAVSTGASRGIQAANELSAILGLQQESVASATELAQANRQTAQEETAAVLENVLNAYQQAEQQRQNLVTAGIQAESLVAPEAEALANIATQYMQAVTNGQTEIAKGLLEEYNALSKRSNINQTDAPVEMDTTKSGIQEDGSLKFNSTDLNEKNVANIYAGLKSAGYNFDEQTVIDLNNVEDYDKIKQNDLDKDTFKGEAAKYINALKSATDIGVGQIVQLNYGDQDSDGNYTFVYLGNNKYAKVNVNAADTPFSIYVPTGYKLVEKYNEGSAPKRYFGNIWNWTKGLVTGGRWSQYDPTKYHITKA